MYDLIILGGGPAGYNAAERAGHGGLKTLLIEGNSLGGVCLNEGCIPTKTLLYSAKIYDYAKHSAEYGVSFSDAKIDHGAVIDRKGRVVKMLVSGVGASMKRAGVEVVNGYGEILGRGSDGFTVKCNGNEYNGAKLLICTGSTAAVPPIPGLRESIESGFGVTNHEILDMKEIPERLVVIGGGVIGLEMASYFCSVGSKVTVIEMLDHIAGPTDLEISKILQKNYMKKGIEFILGAKVTSVGTDCVNYELNGKSESAKADKVLISIGRRARTQGTGIENIGIITERGGIVTDEYCRTNVAGVWAAGDVNGKSMLAHTAYREGEVASVGETTETIKAKGIDAKVESYTLKYSGRYVAENEGGDGIVKLIIGKEHRNILGVHMIGNYASEIIYGAAMMVDMEMRVEQVQKLVFPHPTVGEVLREAMFMI